MKKYDVIIIGAGIVGLAAAHKLRKAQSQLKIAVVEKESQVACHQTGHNSGVIHSGIYYKPGSLKALNCSKGYHLLLKYLEEHQIPFDICGKLIVATTQQQTAGLHALKNRGEANGLTGLRLLNRKQSVEMEPHVNAVESLFVPQAGIVNYKLVAESLYQNLKNHHVDFYFETAVLDMVEGRTEVQVLTSSQWLNCDLVINCAGLFSDQVAEMLQAKIDVRILPFRGEYYDLRPGSEYLVKNLIYPVPDARFPFLGVHLTRKIGGGIEAGPNAVLAMAKEGYSWGDWSASELMQTLSWPGFYKVAAKYWDVGMSEVFRSFSKAQFAKSLQQLIPEIQQADLVKSGSGVRAQACSRDGQLLDDFHIIQSGNSIHVLNAPSPAATSCLAIGETLADIYFHKTNR